MRLRSRDELSLSQTESTRGSSSRIILHSLDTFMFKIDLGFPNVSKKMKNIPDLLSYDKEGKIIENIDFEYFCNRASF